MKQDSFKEFVVGQLEIMDGLVCKSMFGGFGLYSDGKFFGVIFKGRLYFKTDKNSKSDYEARGMKCFQPGAKQN